MAETVSLRNLNIPLPSVAAHIAPSLVREKESILFLVLPVMVAFPVETLKSRSILYNLSLSVPI